MWWADTAHLLIVKMKHKPRPIQRWHSIAVIFVEIWTKIATISFTEEVKGKTGESGLFVSGYWLSDLAMMSERNNSTGSTYREEFDEWMGWWMSTMCCRLFVVWRLVDRLVLETKMGSDHHRRAIRRAGTAVFIFHTSITYTLGSIWSWRSREEENIKTATIFWWAMLLIHFQKKNYIKLRLIGSIQSSINKCWEVLVYGNRGQKQARHTMGEGGHYHYVCILFGVDNARPNQWIGWMEWSGHGQNVVGRWLNVRTMMKESGNK